MRSFWLLLVLCVMVSGCTTLGPAAIQGSRTDYNIAMRQTDDEQLLLNLVRLRYRDRVLFLEPNALSTQFKFRTSASAAATFDDGDTRYGLNGAVAVEETPTVTYTPLQGGDYVTRMLSPIKLETLFLLNSSGWSGERVFRTLVDQMNGVKNAPGANGPTPEKEPEFRNFLRLAKLLRALELKHMVQGARTEKGLVLVFSKKARSLPEYIEFINILDLDPDVGTYLVTSNVAFMDRSTDSVNISFRSFLGVMFFLSQSVEVPERDVAAGRVTVTRDPSGQVFDWSEVTGGLMRIQSSDKRPDNAAVSVSYRGSWFYVDDSDLNSKSTFTMIGQVLALQAGDVKRVVPVLTLPVGG